MSMGFTSLQVCMDSSDNWLQGSIHDENGIDISSSSPSGDILACSRPLMERRLRPPHDQSLKCPRCDSTNTKFCYYNNYSLTQPRYFCKTCRRYWTKGGTLRNIPVGGGCRKNKKVSTNPKKLGNDTNHPSGLILNTHTPGSSSSNPNPIDISHLMGMGSGFYGGYGSNSTLFENSRPIDFVESNYDFMGIGSGDVGNIVAPNFHALNSPFGMGMDGSGGLMMDTCQRLMLPYHEDHGAMDVKPNTKLLALEWQDQGFSTSHDQSKDTFGYVNTLGSSWGGLINGYGSSSTNPLL